MPNETKQVVYTLRVVRWGGNMYNESNLGERIGKLKRMHK
jgi:hypothetical protein